MGHPVGVQPDLLLPTTVSLNCANQTEAGVLGMFLAKISGKSVVSGEEITAHSQVFVVRGKCCLLSRSILSELGCLPEKFPEIGRFPNSKAIDQPAGGTSGIILSSVGSTSGGDQPVRQPEGECDPDSPLPCSCPRTESQPTPSPPPMTPSPSPPPSSVPVSVRPKRERKPNSLYSPEVYDLSKVDIESGDDDDLGLSGLVEDSATLSRKQVIQMFKYIMDRLPADQ